MINEGPKGRLKARVTAEPREKQSTRLQSHTGAWELADGDQVPSDQKG